METNSGNSLPKNLTEDWNCPRHALTWGEAYARYDKSHCFELMHFPSKMHRYIHFMERRDRHWDARHHRFLCSCYYAELEVLNIRVEEARASWNASQSIAEAQAKHKVELGPREFTLTYSPSWYETDEDAQRAMETAIERLTRYYKHEIIEFHAVGEFTRDGRSHVHAWYHLIGGRKITDKNFKRAYPHWNPKRKLGKGFEGGHHATIERTSDFAGYAEKHLEEAWLNVSITNAPESLQEPSSPSHDQEDA